jgi:SAM-dependent methyltransferase
MTTTQEAAAVAVLKRRQQSIWNSGDYNQVASLTVPVAETLAAAANLRPGSRVLDVATGTGHVALAAGRQFSDVSAVDYVPGLLEVARRRADAEGLSIDFRHGDAEDLPFPDGSFDTVLSALGVMFTADHERAAGELVRVTRAGGRIGLASWTPDGFVGQLLKTVAAHVPPPFIAKPPTRWGDPESVRDLLGDQITDLRVERANVTQRFHSAEHFADYFIAYYGPTHTAAESLAPAERAALREDMISLARTANRGGGGMFVAEWDYLLVFATKRGRLDPPVRSDLPIQPRVENGAKDMHAACENLAEAQEQRPVRKVVRTRRRAPRDEEAAARFRLALTRSRVARQH